MLSQNDFFKGIVSRFVSCLFLLFLLTEIKQGGPSVQNMIFSYTNRCQTHECGNWDLAAQFPVKEYINGIFFAVYNKYIIYQWRISEEQNNLPTNRISLGL